MSGSTLYVKNTLHENTHRDEDEKRQQLAQEMDRDGHEITNENYLDVTKMEMETAVQNENLDINNLPIVIYNSSADQERVEEENNEEDNIDDTLPLSDSDGGILFILDEIEEFIADNNEDNSPSSNEGSLATSKRRLHLSDFDHELLSKHHGFTRAQLEMKKEEHNKKMNIYKMKLEQGVEIHRERMKILRAKYKCLQEQVNQIDHVIGNMRLQKRFKSGPI